MSYQQGAPGGPGYPPSHHVNAHHSAPTQQFGRVPEFDAGVRKLPAYLASAIATIGCLVYLASFGPQLDAGSEFFISPFRVDLAVAAAVLAALVAGVGLLPKQTARPALVAVLSLLSLLLLISTMLTAPSSVTIAWGLYLVAAFTAIQTIIAVGALLLDAGVISAPAARPRYEQPQYGQYPGAYHSQQPQHNGPAYQQQRPGYPSQYGGGYPSTDPSTGGFPAVSPSAPARQAGPPTPPSGPPTPPTGSPAYGQPPSSNGPTAQASTQHESGSSQHEPASSQHEPASSQHESESSQHEPASSSQPDRSAS